METEERKNITLRLSRQDHRRFKMLTVALDCDGNALIETLLRDKSAALGIEALMQTRLEKHKATEPHGIEN